MSLRELEPLILPIGVMNIDVTHIRLLHSILTVGKFNHALEIGSFDGASAIAFIAAINDGVLNKVDFCDPYFQPRFYEIIGKCTKPSSVALNPCYSHDAISSKYDCVFVDGDHRLETVSVEAELLVKNEVATIIAHDVNAMNVGFAGCEGAAFLMQYLADNGYDVVYDCKYRPGERTDRGFMFATKVLELYEQVLPLFQAMQDEAV